VLIESGGGLIVCIAAPGTVRYVGNIPYGVGKAGIETLVVDMAEELRTLNVAPEPRMLFPSRTFIRI
jgi:hypothetical protein